MRHTVIVGLLILLSACATTLETVYVPAENRGWKVGSGSNQPGATLVEFIPTAESIGNWSRMFTIQFLEGGKRSPRAVMKVLESQMRARCPGSKWGVVNEDPASVTYEWSLSGCAGHPDQHEVARLLKGNDGVHRIAYVRKTAQLDDTERNTWLKAFANAYVEKGGQKVVVAP
ncbi:MAG: hypothetical protein ABL962_14555 [Fimbriimonadaceae bacterium]